MQVGPACLHEGQEAAGGLPAVLQHGPGRSVYPGGMAPVARPAGYRASGEERPCRAWNRPRSLTDRAQAAVNHGKIPGT